MSQIVRSVEKSRKRGNTAKCCRHRWPPRRTKSEAINKNRCFNSNLSTTSQQLTSSSTHLSRNLVNRCRKSSIKDLVEPNSQHHRTLNSGIRPRQRPALGKLRRVIFTKTLSSNHHRCSNQLVCHHLACNLLVCNPLVCLVCNLLHNLNHHMLSVHYPMKIITPNSDKPKRKLRLPSAAESIFIAKNLNNK